MSCTHVFADAQGGTYLKNVIPIPETDSCRRNTAKVVFMVMLLVLSLPLGILITWINFHLIIWISVHLESYWNRPTAQLSVPLSEVLTPIRGKLNPWCPAHLVLPLTQSAWRTLEVPTLWAEPPVLYTSHCLPSKVAPLPTVCVT